MNKRWICIVISDRPHVHRPIGGILFSMLALEAEMPLESLDRDTVVES
jgi:hypothetical protein